MKILLLTFLLATSSDLRDEIEEERAAHNEELQSPQFASPLTAASQVMIEPGNWTTLTLCQDGVRFGSASGCQPLVEIEFTTNNRFLARPYRRTKGMWGPGTPFTRELSITPGKSDIRGRLLITEPEAAEGYALYFSLQGGNGRVMLHNSRSDNLLLFEGLQYFDVDPDFHTVVKIQSAESQETLELATTQGLQKKYKRIGTVAFEVPEGERKLAVFSPADSPQQYFVPFRDKTNGEDTYPMGRYLYLREGPDPATYILDFNRAFNPYCAYSEYYNCPYPPDENHLDVPIPAGEKLFEKQ
jgi:hypothetical protein